MSRVAEYNPLERFTGLGETYARYRPGYPAAAIDHLLHTFGLGPGAVLVDVGCGTGISSRLLAERGIHVIGIEPNDDMRRQAEVSPLATGPQPSYRAGRAEATGLVDGCADVVLAAQAFHWFDPEPTLREFHRILRPEGWVALMWNERDENDPFTRACGDIIRTVPRAAADEDRRRQAGTALWQSSFFRDAEKVLFRNEQTLTEEELLGRIFSVSYLPRDEAGRAPLAAQLRQVFARFQVEGRVIMRYECRIEQARRR